MLESVSTIPPLQRVTLCGIIIYNKAHILFVHINYNINCVDTKLAKIVCKAVNISNR